MSKVDTRVILSCGFLDHFSSSFNRCQRGFQVMRLNGIFLRLGDAFADVDGSREYTVTFWSRQRQRLAIESLGGQPYVWNSGWLPWNWELLSRGRFHGWNMMDIRLQWICSEVFSKSSSIRLFWYSEHYFQWSPASRRPIFEHSRSKLRKGSANKLLLGIYMNIHHNIKIIHP